MFRNCRLALASLLSVSLFAAQAARAQAIGAHLSLPSMSFMAAEPLASHIAAISLADPNLPATDLPNDPSAALLQGAVEDRQAAQPGQSPSASDSSTMSAQEADRQKAEEQLKEQEKQRVLAVMATFNTTRNHDALPLSPGQKFRLFFKSQTDPWPFTLSAIIAGINQASDSFPEYGQGMQGYAKRFGAAYGDSFIGNFWGNAVLTSLWHEDPRFFQKGTGSYSSRALWAATASVWCKRDNGTWGPNYANVAGNLIGAAIANVYYPASERTAWDTVSRGLSVTAQGAIGAEIIEFWPDIVRHYMKNRTAKAAKQAAAQQDAQNAGGQTTPGPASQPAATPRQ